MSAASPNVRQNIKLILEYDGTGFSGWQKQPGTGLRTVQGVLEEALERLTGLSHVTVGAGRTDAGVHALGQVAHFTTESGFPVERWPAALNGLLPPDVSVRSAEAVDDAFHARCSAKAKEYCYLILNRHSGRRSGIVTPTVSRNGLTWGAWQKAPSCLPASMTSRPFQQLAATPEARCGRCLPVRSSKVVIGLASGWQPMVFYTRWCG